MQASNPHDHDEQFARRALELARQGIALTSPNPCVGAVIATPDGTIVGEGFHTYEGKKHAEILALEQAGTRARGATIYVTLEPCSHQGSTGHCADAVIATGIARVVCSMEDPNPQVAGRGFAKLRAAGIQVDMNLFEADAGKPNEAFAKYIRHKAPLVTLKSAMTLDGKIARGTDLDASVRGTARTDWITGEVARAHVQQLRHQSDAILTGIGTVLADDPLLTDRTGLPRRRSLLRVVLDSHLRLPLASRISQSAREDVLVFTEDTDLSRKNELEKLGIRVELVPRSGDNALDLSAILNRLGELEITSLLIEGGSHLNASVLDSRLVDKVFLFLAPKIFGDAGVPFAAGLHQSIEFTNPQFHQFADDCAIEGYLSDPYSG